MEVGDSPVGVTGATSDRAYGQSYPRLTLTLEDTRGGGLTIVVLNLDAVFRRDPAVHGEGGARYPRPVFIQRVQARSTS